MVIKKNATSSSNGQVKPAAKDTKTRAGSSKTVYRYFAYEVGGDKKMTVGRGLLILILMIINIVVWSYFPFQLHVWREEEAYSARAAKQYEAAARREKQRERQAIAMDTVALVGNKPITMRQVRAMADMMDPLKEMPFEQVYPNLLNDIINAQVLLQNAKAAGVVDRPDVQQMRDNIVQRVYLEEQLAAHVTEAELRALYDEELKNFKREEEIHARHILVKTEKEAQDIIIQLNAGADFAELANKKSLDETTAEGGDLGYFTKAMMIPEFGNVVFDMKKGQLSEPIKTVFGWHVVFVEDKRLANPPSFDDVRDEIFLAVAESKLPQVLEEERAKLNVQILKPTWESVE